MESKYSIWRGIGKTVIQVMVFGFPLLLTSLSTMPETAPWMDLTIGGLLSLLMNFFKVKAKEADLI